MKASMHASHSRGVLQEVGRGSSHCCIRRKFSEPVVFCTYTKAISRGSDPTNV